MCYTYFVLLFLREFKLMNWIIFFFWKYLPGKCYAIPFFFFTFVYTVHEPLCYNFFPFYWKIGLNIPITPCIEVESPSGIIYLLKFIYAFLIPLSFNIRYINRKNLADQPTYIYLVALLHLDHQLLVVW